MITESKNGNGGYIDGVYVSWLGRGAVLFDPEQSAEALELISLWQAARRQEQLEWAALVAADEQAQREEQL